MLPYGNSNSYSSNSQQSNMNENSYKYLETMSMLGMKYDFENPLYAREGFVSKLMKQIKKQRRK